MVSPSLFRLMPPVGDSYRRISPSERSYLFHDRYNEQSMILSAVFEGHGEFDLTKWQAAMDKVALAHPGSRLIKKGRLGFSTWQVGAPHIPVTLIENSQWNGMGPENADFLRRRLSPITGPVCEVLLVKSDKLRVIFRLHHSVSDARGMSLIVDDAFRVLKGEKPKGANSTLCDIDMLEKIDSPKAQASPRSSIAPTGPPVGECMSLMWQRKQLLLKDYKLIPKIMLAIKQATDELALNEPDTTSNSNSGETRIRLTVDLRRHLPRETRTTANCSGVFDICVSSEDTTRDLIHRINKSLKIKQEAACSPTLAKLARWVPTSLNGIRDKTLLKIHKTGRYIRSGTLTMIPKSNKEDYSAAGFITETAYALPPPLKLLPFFMTLWAHDDGVEMVVGMPALLGNKGRLNNFVNQVAAAVTEL